MTTNRYAELTFNAVSIEGGLLAADWLGRIAELKAPHQTLDDYDIPKGLEFRDEIARNWRIAKAVWTEFENARIAKADPHKNVQYLLTQLLDDAFGFDDIKQQPELETPSLMEASAPYRLQPIEHQERLWPITALSHQGHFAIVCAPDGMSLDATDAQFGDENRPRRSAFGLTQEFLNASDDILWGLCSNGVTLRLLRENVSLTRPAWIDFDLESIFTGELYAEFTAMWLILHRSRFPQSVDDAESCPIESWRATAIEEGTRARDRLRGGFEKALRIFGQGFYAHPDNHALRQALQNGSLSLDDYFGELLRLVYRLIFLLTIEERDLLHPKRTLKEVQERYAEGYSIRRLRDRSTRRSAHDRFHDLWDGLTIVFKGLSQGEDALGLPALAGLFASDQCPTIDQARLKNSDLMGALFELSWLRETTGISRVNWRDMGPDELGYVYEGLLELVPTITENGQTFAFASDDESRGNARKTSGSYYTPDSLVELLLKSTLEPVIKRTIAKHIGEPKRAAKELLKLSIVDPACGSGHFLLAAGRRLAERVAGLQAEGTPTPEEYRSALRQVVGQCLYGVDLNPLAVELCKVALWMEAIEPGLPLTFLNTHIRHGNALLGTSLDLMDDEVPDDAWAVHEQDVRATNTSLKRRNRIERDGQETFSFGKPFVLGDIQRLAAEIEKAPDNTAAALAKKEQQWMEFRESEDYRHAKLVYDAWCSAFMWPKPESGALVENAPTNAVWLSLREGRSAGTETLVNTVNQIANEYDFFHWELEFAPIFQQGGFDIVLGNPPWEHVELKEQEYFAQSAPEIAKASGSQRKKKIAELADTNPALYQRYIASKRHIDTYRFFIGNSGAYPLCGRGRIKTDPIFAELSRRIMKDIGRLGIIVPTGIATDATTQNFFKDLVNTNSIVSLFDFENRKPLFVGVDSRFKFCLLTLVGSEGEPDASQFAFFLRDPSELDDPDKSFSLTAEEIILLNPNTGTLPVFRSRRDAEITLGIYRRIPILINKNDVENGNPWGIRFMQGLFNMTSDSHLFHTKEELEDDGWELEGNIFKRSKNTPPPERTNEDQIETMLPLYEAKMMHHYDTRWATYEGDGKTRYLTEEEKRAGFAPMPRYWVHESEVDRKLEGKWDKTWMLGWRDICRSTDARTVIAAQLPRVAIGHKVLLMLPARGRHEIQAITTSLVFDFAARQKLGGTSLPYFTFMQLPVPLPQTLQPWKSWMAERVDRLNAQTLSEEENAVLRAELDAAAFEIYGIPREDIEYILDTFPIVRRNDEAKYGEYRTKRLILETYDERRRTTHGP